MHIPTTLLIPMPSSSPCCCYSSSYWSSSEQLWKSLTAIWALPLSKSLPSLLLPFLGDFTMFSGRNETNHFQCAIVDVYVELNWYSRIFLIHVHWYGLGTHQGLSSRIKEGPFLWVNVQQTFKKKKWQNPNFEMKGVEHKLRNWTWIWFYVMALIKYSKLWVMTKVFFQICEVCGSVTITRRLNQIWLQVKEESRKIKIPPIIWRHVRSWNIFFN